MIALYKRLSLADGDIGVRGKSESNSIEHQGDLLISFVSSRREFNGIKTVDYIDDGYTGINFERPAFKKMMEGVKSGEIDTIIVKDISRFGRDYIGVGEYLEQLFPLLGVRFIAVNNNYDSNNYKGMGLNLDMAVNNLVNTMYSRDIGRKLHTSNEVKWKKGYSTGSAAPFGYIFDPVNKGRFIIDNEAAKIVRYIFELALKGCNTTMIAYELNEKKIPIPSEYNRVHNITGKKRQYTITPDKIWNSAKVWRIIRSYEYTGAMVLGKSRVMMPGTDVVRNMPKERQYITENAHEAIVTHDEWERAQRVIRKNSGGAYPEKRDFPLKKKIRCGHCRRVMNYDMRTSDAKVWCREGKNMPRHSKCPKAQYSINMIDMLVWSALCKFIKLMSFLNDKITEYDNKRADSLKKADIKSETGYNDIVRAADGKLKLYEEYAEGNISLEAYKLRKEEIDKKTDSRDLSDYIQEEISEESIAISPEIRYMAEKSEMYAFDNKLTGKAADIYIENVYIHDGGCIEIRYCHIKEISECMEKLGLEMSDDDWYSIIYIDMCMKGVRYDSKRSI